MSKFALLSILLVGLVLAIANGNRLQLKNEFFLLLIFDFFKLAGTLSGHPRIIRSTVSATPVSAVSRPSEKLFLTQPAGVIEDIGNTINDFGNTLENIIDDLDEVDMFNLENTLSDPGPDIYNRHFYSSDALAGMRWDGKPICCSGGEKGIEPLWNPWASSG